MGSDELMLNPAKLKNYQVMMISGLRGDGA